MSEPSGGQATARANAAALPFLVSLAVTTLIFWTVDIVSPAIPNLKSSLNLSAKMAGLVYAVLFFGRLIGNFPAAWLTDRIGTGRTGAIGGVILAVGSLTIATAPGVALVYPGRFLQGVGIAFTVNAILRSLIRTRPDRGAAMTFFQFASTIGTVFGLEIGGAMTEAFSWRSVFFLSVALAGVIAAVAFAAPNAYPERVARPTFAAPETGPIAWATIVPALSYNFLVFVNYSVFVSAPLYAERRFQATAGTIANFLMTITVMHLAGAFPSGRAIRRWGSRGTMAAGILMACVAMALIPLTPSVVWIAAALALYGIGQITSSNAAGDLVLDVCGRGARAVGLLRLSCDLGLVIGPFAAGALADSFGYQAPFVVLPVLSIAPLVMVLRRPKPAVIDGPLSAVTQ